MESLINEALIHHYLCPDEWAGFRLSGDLSQDLGYFTFGPENICFGRTSEVSRSERPTGSLLDVSGQIIKNGTGYLLPFDPTEVIGNLRLERYARQSERTVLPSAILRRVYYSVRPMLMRSVRTPLQRWYLRDWTKTAFPSWPVDRTVESILERLMRLAIIANGGKSVPFIWFWPEGASACVILTHDVEYAAGRDSCGALMDLDDSLGIKASFQLVPEERYAVTQSFIRGIRERGFEVNVHDLNHDGRLYEDRDQFEERARKINRYAREYGAAGFRAGGLYRNQDWYGAFDFDYDMSVPNVGHLDPQKGGCCTIFPYFIGEIVELPSTTIHDYTLFHILKDYSIGLWQQQIDLIAEKHGLISFTIHPDYIIRPLARITYVELLQYLRRLRSEQRIWTALPGEVSRWWRQRGRMRLIQDGSDWRVEGVGAERARLAYAVLEGDRLVYKVQDPARPKVIG